MSFKPIELRKIRKPLMEKKRRARINDSLNTLKQILLQNTVAIPTSGGRIAKLEKADILEMTVRYVKNLHRRLGVPVDPMDTVSSTSESTDEESFVVNREIYKNLLNEIDRPVGLSHLARENVPKIRKNLKLPRFEIREDLQDKENLVPEKEKMKKEQKGNENKGFKSENELHWRPW
ncbi:transcription factor HES-1-A-like [Culicoides brevitarsis]|uniref:transcription factor HES-1-A-like n=1 Tax=Culicoides brevitarsis TaxID=469753 RepID=UPI00307B1260